MPALHRQSVNLLVDSLVPCETALRVRTALLLSDDVAVGRACGGNADVWILYTPTDFLTRLSSGTARLEEWATPGGNYSSFKSPASVPRGGAGRAKFSATC